MKSHKRRTKQSQLPFRRFLIPVLVFILLILVIRAKENRDVKIGFYPQFAAVTNGYPSSTILKIKPKDTINIAGYNVVVTFDSNKTRVTDIQYSLGATSIGLGDDQSSLERVNQRGVINLQGETHTPEGALLVKDQLLDLVKITFTPTSTSKFPFELDLKRSSFVVIDKDFKLTEIPVALLYK